MYLFSSLYNTQIYTIYFWIERAPELVNAQTPEPVNANATHKIRYEL